MANRQKEIEATRAEGVDERMDTEDVVEEHHEKEDAAEDNTREVDEDVAKKDGAGWNREERIRLDQHMTS